MKKLDDLINDLGNVKPFLSSDPLMEYGITYKSHAEIMEALQEIQADLAELHKCVEAETPHQFSAQLANELGVPMNFKNWSLQEFDVEAVPNDLPKLTATYIYIGVRV